MAWPKLHQLAGVLAYPPREAEIVIGHRDDARPGLSANRSAVIIDHDSSVRAVDLLGNDHLAVEAGDLREFFKLDHMSSYSGLQFRVAQLPAWSVAARSV